MPQWLCLCWVTRMTCRQPARFHAQALFNLHPPGTNSTQSEPSPPPPLTLHLLGPGVQLLCMAQELSSHLLIPSLEEQVAGGEGRSHRAQEVAGGRGECPPESGATTALLLRPAPVIVVDVGVPDLAHILVLTHVAVHEVLRCEPDVLHRVVGRAGRGKGLGEVQSSPGQEGHCLAQGEVELQVVAGVVPGRERAGRACYSCGSGQPRCTA